MPSGVRRCPASRISDRLNTTFGTELEWFQYLWSLSDNELLDLKDELIVHEEADPELREANAYRIMGNEYVHDGKMLTLMHRLGQDTIPCKLISANQACDMCYDDYIAEAQMQEGKKNRGKSKDGTPALVPDDYKGIEQALDRTFSFTFFDDKTRWWKRYCKFDRSEKQYNLSREFRKNPWCCDLGIRPGCWDLQLRGGDLYEQLPEEQRRIELLVHPGRASQLIFGACNATASELQRQLNSGTIKDKDECFVDRDITADEVHVLGTWKLDRMTNGTFRDLVLSFNSSQNEMSPTIGCLDGPWTFHRCDIRNIQGVPVYATANQVQEVLRHSCDKHVGTDHYKPEGYVTPSDASESDSDSELETGPDGEEIRFSDPKLQRRHGGKPVDFAQDVMVEEKIMDDDRYQSDEDSDLDLPCIYKMKPRDAIMHFELCGIGGVEDTLLTRSFAGLVADERSIITATRCTFEDTYLATCFSDSAKADMNKNLFQRNGVAVQFAECAQLGMIGNRFENQRLAIFDVARPPELVSIYAVDGGPTGYGTISTPAYGIGDTKDPDIFASVPWIETAMHGREPRLNLSSNCGDCSARLWWSAERPGTLRSSHSVGADNCGCKRFICDLSCEPECLTANHRGRMLDASRDGECPLLASENQFSRMDDPREPLVSREILARRHIEEGTKAKDLFDWQKECIIELKQAEMELENEEAQTLEERRLQLREELEMEDSSLEDGLSFSDDF